MEHFVKLRIEWNCNGWALPPPSLCVHIPLPDVTWYHCTWWTSHTFLLCIYILAALKILEAVMVWNKANPCIVMSGEWHIPSWSLSKQGNLGTRLGCSFNLVGPVAASLLETKIPYPTLQQLSNTHTFLGSLVLSSPIYYNLPSQGNLSIQRCLCFLSFLHQQIKALSFLHMKSKLRL